MMLNLVNDSDKALFPRQEPVTFSPEKVKMTTKVNPANLAQFVAAE
jgi:hypothetical protein